MCLAIPAQIETIEDDCGTVCLAGSRSRIQLALVPGAKVGDWVLVHAGFAITVLSPEDAKATYDLLAEVEASVGSKPDPEIR